MISHNASGGSTTVPLTGTTLLRPLISLSATTLAFGSVIINTDSSLMSVVVTNTGNIDLHLSSVSITGANPGDFTQVGSTCVSGGVVTATTSCTVILKFNTSQLGGQSASLQIVHDAAGSPSSVALTGTGIPVPAPDIQLNQTSLTFAPLIIGTASPTQTVTPAQLRHRQPGLQRDHADRHGRGGLHGDGWLLGRDTGRSRARPAT